MGDLGVNIGNQKLGNLPEVRGPAAIDTAAPIVAGAEKLARGVEAAGNALLHYAKIETDDRSTSAYNDYVKNLETVYTGTVGADGNVVPGLLQTQGDSARGITARAAAEREKIYKQTTKDMPDSVRKAFDYKISRYDQLSANRFTEHEANQVTAAAKRNATLAVQTNLDQAVRDDASFQAYGNDYIGAVEAKLNQEGITDPVIRNQLIRNASEDALTKFALSKAAAATTDDEFQDALATLTDPSIRPELMRTNVQLEPGEELISPLKLADAQHQIGTFHRAFQSQQREGVKQNQQAVSDNIQKTLLAVHYGEKTPQQAIAALSAVRANPFADPKEIISAFESVNSISANAEKATASHTQTALDDIVYRFGAGTIDQKTAFAEIDGAYKNGAASPKQAQEIKETILKTPREQLLGNFSENFAEKSDLTTYMDLLKDTHGTGNPINTERRLFEAKTKLSKGDFDKLYSSNRAKVDENTQRAVENVFMAWTQLDEATVSGAIDGKEKQYAAFAKRAKYEKSGWSNGMATPAEVNNLVDQTKNFIVRNPDKDPWKDFLKPIIEPKIKAQKALSLSQRAALLNSNR